MSEAPGTSTHRHLRIAIIGGGWAGLSAAVHAVHEGHSVVVYEMARHWGGRARTMPDSGFDNGQHVLIGAYRDTLSVMALVGADPGRLLLRMPLTLQRCDGRSLQLGSGPAATAFMAAVMRCKAWTLPDKLRLLAACTAWAAAGFSCEPDRSVDVHCRAMPAAVRELLIDPLCVAALNTPASAASAAAFLRVIRDGLFGGRGASDLLLPCGPLGELFAQPAARWLADRRAELRLGHRVRSLERAGPAWTVDGQPFDAAVLACSAVEAARLARPVAADWAQLADALRFEPIVTVYARGPEVQLPVPMLLLHENARWPAQFVFDHGQISGRPGLLAFVISGASNWVEAGNARIAAAVLDQARGCLPQTGSGLAGLQVEAVLSERRATFLSTPGLVRPPPCVGPGLVAAGDFVAGPYPATLEGATRSGRQAIEALRRLARGLPAFP